MERKETNWNDLPSEIQAHVIEQLDLVEDPRQIQRVKQVSKWANEVCGRDKTLIAWYMNNFSSHLPPQDPIPTIHVIIESYADEIGAFKTNKIVQNYLEELKSKNTLYSFVLTYDLEHLARKLIRQQKILTTATEIQAIFANDAVYCMKEFIAYGNGPNYVINMGRTLLHSACYYNAYGCAKVLLEMGANVQAVENVWQQTPLHIAVQRGTLNLIQLLLEYKSDMLAQDKDLLTPLGMCTLYGVPEVKNFAIEYKRAHGLN